MLVSLLDTVRGYELVLPSGVITTVTELSDPDLFFALKVKNIHSCVCRSAEMMSGWIQQLREPLGDAVKTLTLTIGRLKGIVTKFTLKTFPQTQVWVRSLFFFGTHDF